MKKIINYVILLTVSTLLWNCKSEEPGPQVVPEPTTWELNLVENEPQPSWEPPASGVYQFSMTAIIRLSDFLETYADAGDEISAFVADECRGITKGIDTNGRSLYFLHIRGNSPEKQRVTLKYYSVRNKKTYVCRDLLEFTQNGTYGKASEPAIPPFEESGKYPEVMTAVVALAEPLPFDSRDKDLLAAFVGDECRGVGEAKVVEGKKVYMFEIRGKKEEKSSVYFQYYSFQTSGIYKASETFSFSKDGSNGNEGEPFMLSLQPVIE